MDKFKWWAILLVLLVVPLYPKFPLIGVGGTFVAIRLEDLLIGVVLIFFGLVTVKQRFVDLGKPIPRAILLYWAVGFVSVFSAMFLTKTAGLSLGLLHWLRRVEYMSMFLVGYTFITSKKQLEDITRVVLVVGLAVALYGLGQQYLKFPLISTTNSEFAKGLALTLGPGARINSTFAGHYDLAAFCLFPLLIILAVLAGKTNYKWLLLGIGGLVYWVMLLSASRITFAALLLTTGLFIVIIRKWHWLIGLFIAAVLSIFISPQLAGRYRELIITRFNSLSLVSVARAVEREIRDVNTIPDALKPTEVAEDRSLNIRLKASWPKALRSLAKNPILGTGYSSVGLAVDNDFLRQLAETGILGLASLILVFVRLFKSWLPANSTFALAMVCATIGLLLNAIFIDIFEASKIAIIFWLLAGVTTKLNELK